MGKFIVKNGILVRDKSFYGEWGTALKVRDVAFTFRMGNGFAGSVNRTHPATIAAYLKDATNPPTFFGQPVLLNPTAGTVRGILDLDRTGGTAQISGGNAIPITDIFGVVVRPYPFQGVTAPSASYAGTGSFPTAAGSLPDGAVDILLSGFIMVTVNGSPTNGSQAFVWTAATSSPHVQGGWEASSPSTSGLALTWDKTTFASPVDASGIAELRVNV